MNNFENPNKEEIETENEAENKETVVEEIKKESLHLIRVKRYLQNTVIGLTMIAGSAAFLPGNAEAGNVRLDVNLGRSIERVLNDLARVPGKVINETIRHDSRDKDQERRQAEQEYRMLLKQRDQTLREISQARTQEELNLAQEKYNIIDQKIKEIEMSQQAQ